MPLPFQFQTRGQIYRGLLLLICTLLIALSGFFSRRFGVPIEQLFILAAGLSNGLALWDLGHESLKNEHTPRIRFWLTLELIFFCSVLGVDVNFAFGEDGATILMFVSAAIIPIVLLVISRMDQPKDKMGFLESGLLFTASLYLIPPLIRRLTPYTETIFSPLLGKDVWITFCIRSYAFLHLLLIPGVYLLVDWQVSKTNNNWSRYLFLDICLCTAGFACALAGFGYSFPPQIQKYDEPLFETGAAALMLLVGNAWYLNFQIQRINHAATSAE